MHFLILFGPPAVGKMTVGREVERATGIRLFHNHMTIEPVLNFFPFGTPAFARLIHGFRQSLFEEVAESDLPGLCFTFVWNLDGPADRLFLEDACELFRERCADIAFIELKADLSRRLERNRLEDRLREKPSRRDLEKSEADLLNFERYRMNSDGKIPLEYPHLVIDNNNRTAIEAADIIIEKLSLVRQRPG